MKRTLIVGGVAGGASCAARLRRLDETAEIFIFERTGDVSFANCGLPYYLGGVIAERRQLLMASPERFRDVFNIEVRTRHEVLRVDRENQTIEVKNLPTGEIARERYDALVLATGAEALRPSLPGVNLPGVFTIRNLDDADRVHAWIHERRPTRAVVVGAGYIGLEMVENLSRLGVAVALIEQADHVMPAADPEMASPLEKELLQQGIDLRLGRSVTAFEPGPNDSILVAVEGEEKLATDLVILSVGIRPDTQLARECGLEIGPTGGIRVDGRMRTSDPAIFAVGDAVEVCETLSGQPMLASLAGPANRQGRIAADVICGRDAHFRGAQGTAVVGLFGLTLAMTGATEQTLRRRGLAFEKSYTYATQHAAYYPGAKRIAMKLLFSPESGRVLGAQAIGHEGVERRIDAIAVAIQMKATVFDLEEAELCYAPPYGSAKDPVNIAGFVASNILRGDVAVRHWSEWRERAAVGNAPVTLDVRPTRAAGALPNAIHIPMGELRSRLDELPRDREIWVHCNVGQNSYYAVRLLAQKGFRVCNLSGGFTSYQMEE